MTISVTPEEAAILSVSAEQQAGTASCCLSPKIGEVQHGRCSAAFLVIGSAFVIAATTLVHAQNPVSHASFELLTHRMDVDVDGAPNAYGPPGKPALDLPIHARSLEPGHHEIVGYLLDETQRPVLQGPKDPYP